MNTVIIEANIWPGILDQYSTFLYSSTRHEKSVYFFVSLTGLPLQSSVLSLLAFATFSPI